MRAMSQLTDARLRAAAAYGRVMARGDRADVPGVPHDPDDTPPEVEPAAKPAKKTKKKSKSKKEKSHMATHEERMKDPDYARGFNKGMAEIKAEDGDEPKDRERLQARAAASAHNPVDGVLRAGKGMHGRVDMLDPADRIMVGGGFNGVEGHAAARALLPAIETMVGDYSFTSKLAPGGSAPTQKQADRALADARKAAGR